ncbi:MAG: inorganic pyrophosphatase [Oscillospiraceae bacterium]|nr:inorganic pyrophosphatase [Oscillospiraceae bacterium]
MIDRPKGSYHPEHPQIYYEIDYGYLKGTNSPDGEDVDVWVGASGDLTVVGIIATVDLAKQDTEIKLLLGCSEEEIRIIDEFYGKWGMQRGLVILREEEEC